ncbi:MULTISPECIES: helix-turn-helix domain-containing protein [Streptomyces]|uniref:helix-turn-helix domain-containing protein n=1 Tax=Streptomyces TaxID=1883 RepID=UPI000A3BC17C|nr:MULTISPECIES: helix-turn-helix transcriptional regulator [Streptomyces]
MAKDPGPVGRYGQSKVGWEFFGSELKRRREAVGLSQQELGRRVFCSGAYIGQFETAVRKPQLDVAQRIDVELQTEGFFERMCTELINNSPYVNYFAETAYLQGLASTIHEFAPTFVPGLLQTEAYARGVFLGGFPFAPEDRIQTWITARLERARMLEHPTRPLLWVVLDECVIRRSIGGAGAMSEQLAHLVNLVEKRRIGVQVLPFGAGAPALGGALSLMTFEDAPPVAYTEGVKSGQLLDEPALVGDCRRLYDLVTAAALSLEASLSLIKSAAEEYAHERR